MKFATFFVVAPLFVFLLLGTVICAHARRHKAYLRRASGTNQQQTAFVSFFISFPSASSIHRPPQPPLGRSEHHTTTGSFKKGDAHSSERLSGGLLQSTTSSVDIWILVSDAQWYGQQELSSSKGMSRRQGLWKWKN